MADKHNKKPNVSAIHKHPNILFPGNNEEMIEQNDISSDKLNSTLQGYEITSSKHLSKKYNIQSPTILDERLGDIMLNTLDFMTYSGDNYMKKVYEAERILKEKDPSGSGKVSPYHKYVMGFSLFCLDDTNAIYLGIILIFLSLIIYFMSIVSTNDRELIGST